MGFTEEAVAELKKPLSPALPKVLKGNRYLEGHIVISQANRIFGFDGWGYDVLSVQLERIENVNQDGVVSHQFGYSATVRVEVQGAPPRVDVGFNTVQKWKNGYTPDGHDTAMKGAVTDAMKRALRSFGHQFGNGLYGDGTYEQKIENGQHEPAPAQNGSGKVEGGHVEFMDDQQPPQADGKLLGELQRLGAEVCGESEWMHNGIAEESAKWASGKRVAAIHQLNQQEALKLQTELKARLEKEEN